MNIKKVHPFWPQFADLQCPKCYQGYQDHIYESPEDEEDVVDCSCGHKFIVKREVKIHYTIENL